MAPPPENVARNAGHNAGRTAAMHFEERLHRGSWDAILSNVFVNYVYNVLPLQYPTISRQVGLRTKLHVPPETLKFECNFLVNQDLSGHICNVISSNVFVNDTYNDLTLQDQPISCQTGLRTTWQPAMLGSGEDTGGETDQSWYTNVGKVDRVRRCYLGTRELSA